MKVYIVRHGEVPHNALKQYNNENEDLNENEIRQANELKEKIKNINYAKKGSCQFTTSRRPSAKMAVFKNGETVLCNYRSYS